MATSDLTDQMMVNPWMFDPTQKSNQFSQYNNAPLPFPPTYGGTPVSAATGQPIQSYQQWLQQNPGGVSLNATPAQPQAPQVNTAALAQLMARQSPPAGPTSWGNNQSGYFNPPNSAQIHQQLNGIFGQQGAGPTGTPAAAPQGSGTPNNWQAALSALANPGTPQIGGANVPAAQGSQPGPGSVNAYLQQAQGRPNVNPQFLSALSAIQGRRQ